jgi:hypothetical protein
VGGTLSPDAMRTMMGAVILKTLNFLRERKREFPHVTLALDEATNANLIGEAGHEVAALAELRKYGLGMHILVQRLDFPSGIERDVLTNCATRKYFQCPEPRTAMQLGADLGGTYTTHESKTRYYKDGSTWDAPGTVENPFADDLRNLSRGECFIRRGNRNTRERITPLPDPFAVSKAAAAIMTRAYLDAIKERAEYYSPTNEYEQQPANESATPQQLKQDNDSPFGI